VFVLGKATVEIPDRVKPGLGLTMAEQIISLHVELLPEGCYLATSEAIPGLVAQGRTTVAETLEIARDVAKRLLEARAERGEHTAMSPVGDCLDLPLVVGG
jgi:predicted RNase H-like HicB family nuclease